MSIIVKHRTDLDVVAERVGVKLDGGGRSERQARPAAGCLSLPASGPARHGAALLEFARSCAARAWRSAPRSCSTPSRRSSDGRAGPTRGLPRGAGRDARQVAGGPRVFELVFDRFFFRAAEREALERGAEERFEGGADGLDLDALRERSREAIRDGPDGEMRDLARLAIAAFGRQGEGSGVIGVDVQRIRRALGLRARPSPTCPQDDPRREPAARAAARFERHLRRELERR
jgi:hypothetical protein